MPLRQQIQQRIAEISGTADLLPGITIVHNLRTHGVEYMSQLGLRTLGTTLPELWALGSDYYPKYFNASDTAEYLPKLLALLERNNDDEVLGFFQQVRATEHHPWSWYLSTVRIFLRDEQGQPLLSLTFACPLDSLSYVTPKVTRFLAENTFSRQNQAQFAQLTQRERQVLRLLVLGKNSAEIANELFISANTVLTHRRNINTKLHPETPYDLSRYAHAFNLV